MDIYEEIGEKGLKSLLFVINYLFCSNITTRASNFYYKKLSK